MTGTQLEMTAAIPLVKLSKATPAQLPLPMLQSVLLIVGTDF